MTGYLEQYGAGEERREKIVKRSMIAVGVLAVVLLIVVLPLWLYFRNHREESQVRNFFQLLAAQNYKQAYALWGCTDAQPCSSYPMSSFMQDWGPQAGLSHVVVIDGQSCGSGVIVDSDAGTAGDKKLWVERDSLVIGFPPFSECPRQNRISDFVRDIKYRIHGRTFKQ